MQRADKSGVKDGKRIEMRGKEVRIEKEGRGRTGTGMPEYQIKREHDRRGQ